MIIHKIYIKTKLNVHHTIMWLSIKAGIFLLVDFLGELRNKTRYKYLCLVQSIDEDDGEVIVKGMKKEYTKGAELFINNNNICKYIYISLQR